MFFNRIHPLTQFGHVILSLIFIVYAVVLEMSKLLPFWQDANPTG